MNSKIVVLAVAAVFSAAPAVSQEWGATEVKEDGKGGLYLPTQIQGDVGVFSSDNQYIGVVYVRSKEEVHAAPGKKLRVLSKHDGKFREVTVKDLKKYGSEAFIIPLTKAQFVALPWR